MKPSSATQSQVTFIDKKGKKYTYIVTDTGKLKIINVK
jgi:hypothetical protein